MQHGEKEIIKLQPHEFEGEEEKEGDLTPNTDAETCDALESLQQAATVTCTCSRRMALTNHRWRKKRWLAIFRTHTAVTWTTFESYSG